MRKKLTKKERTESVNKGYLEDQEFVTKSYLDERFQYYIGVLEDQNQDRFQVIFEELKSIREENGKRIKICEARLNRVENKLGFV